MKAQGIANPVRQRPNKRLYNLKEASEYLGRSLWGMRELMYKGCVPYVKFDRRIYFDIRDLDEVIESHKERFNDD